RRAGGGVPHGLGFRRLRPGRTRLPLRALLSDLGRAQQAAAAFEVLRPGALAGLGQGHVGAHRLTVLPSGGASQLPLLDNLFSTLSYAMFAAPAVAVVIWVVWRLMVWCLFYATLVSTWVGSQPAVIQIPTLIGLVLV